MGDARLTALITGASSGIGRDLAHLFAADGHHVVLVARRVEALRAVADDLVRRHRIKAVAIAADLTQPDAHARMLTEIAGHNMSVDVVVNNAGFGMQGTVAELP